MPYSYDQAAIEEYWGWCGAIEGLDMMTFPDTGRFRCGVCGARGLRLGAVAAGRCSWRTHGRGGTLLTSTQQDMHHHAVVACVPMHPCARSRVRRGIVFITFETQEGFEAALACNGETLDGQTLKVRVWQGMCGRDACTRCHPGVTAADGCMCLQTHSRRVRHATHVLRACRHEHRWSAARRRPWQSRSRRR
jgi:hypothetical protein